VTFSSFSRTAWKEDKVPEKEGKEEERSTKHLEEEKKRGGKRRMGMSMLLLEKKGKGTEEGEPYPLLYERKNLNNSLTFFSTEGGSRKGRLLRFFASQRGKNGVTLVPAALIRKGKGKNQGKDHHFTSSQEDEEDVLTLGAREEKKEGGEEAQICSFLWDRKKGRKTVTIVGYVGGRRGEGKKSLRRKGSE